MALTVTKVLTDPRHFSPPSNCYFQNSAAVCLENGAYRWMRWEAEKTSPADAQFLNAQMRMFGSADDGVTWTLLTTVSPLPLKTTWIRLYPLGGTRLLVGINDEGGYTYDSQYSALPGSDDGGLTWTSRISQALFDTIPATGFTAVVTNGVVRLSATTILAGGRYEFTNGGPGMFHVLRSTDNGATFTPLAQLFFLFEEFSIKSMVAVSPTTVIAAVGPSTTGESMWRSTDAGVTWAPAVNSHTVNAVTALDATTLLGIASAGVVVRSTDAGVTWAAFSTVTTASTETIQAVTDTFVIIGGRRTTDNRPTWWFSDDAGATWAQGTLVGTATAGAGTNSITITNTGAILADSDVPTSGVAHTAEIWRGLIDGLVTTVGTCEALTFEPPEPPVVGAVMGIRLDCVPILSPAPCPQLCPVDPLQPEAQLVLPSGVGGGYLSPVFVLGLAEGLSAQAVVSMGLPAACGATFANNNCAVVGA